MGALSDRTNPRRLHGGRACVLTAALQLRLRLGRASTTCTSRSGRSTGSSRGWAGRPAAARSATGSARPSAARCSRSGTSRTTSAAAWRAWSPPTRRAAGAGATPSTSRRSSRSSAPPTCSCGCATRRSRWACRPSRSTATTLAQLEQPGAGPTSASSRRGSCSSLRARATDSSGFSRSANFFVYIARYSMLDWGPIYLREVKGAILDGGGWGDGLIEFARHPVARILMGWLSDRLGGRRGLGEPALHDPDLSRVRRAGAHDPPGRLWLDMALLGVVGFFVYPPVMLLGVTGARPHLQEGGGHGRRLHRALRLPRPHGPGAGAGLARPALDRRRAAWPRPGAACSGWWSARPRSARCCSPSPGGSSRAEHPESRGPGSRGWADARRLCQRRCGEVFRNVAGQTAGSRA